MLRRFFHHIVMLCVMLSVSYNLLAQEKGKVPYLSYVRHAWVDSVFKTMSLDQKLGQMLFIASRSPQDSLEVLKLVKDYHVGGIVFFRGKAAEQVSLVNSYQSHSRVPLAIAMDAEWGAGMRLKEDAVSFPYAMTVGAVQDDELVFQMGKRIAKHLKRVGTQINFGPVADVNSNALNPVINYRSFGENPEKVYQKAWAYVNGLQSEGVLAVVKHFPGHGDTNTDSHYTLPLLTHDRQRLDEVELYPFRKLIDKGVGGVMTAHLSIPALDSTKNLASSLSPTIIQLLKQEMGFNGLTITDGINMKGIIDYYPAGTADAKAIVAGNDIVEFSMDVPKAVKELKRALKDGEISIAEIDSRVRKILAMKYWVGLSKPMPLSAENILADLQTPEDARLYRRISEEAVTVLQNKDGLLPIKSLSDLKIASLSIGSDTLSAYQSMLSSYMKVTPYQISVAPSQEEIDRLLSALVNYDIVLVGLHQVYMSPGAREITVDIQDSKQKVSTVGFGITPATISLIDQLTARRPTVVSVFGTPYAVSLLQGIEKAKGLLVTYQDTREMQQIAAQIIFGALPAKGILPVSIGDRFKEGHGLQWEAIKRLSYGQPEDVGMNVLLPAQVDALVQEALSQKAFPGCQVLIAKDGRVIFNKAYGYHDYSGGQKVKTSDLYDLASVTKITGSLPALMRLVGEGKLDVEKPFSQYWDGFEGPDKKDITLKEMLAHQAGLPSGLPLWKPLFVQGNTLSEDWIQVEPSSRHTLHMAPNLYLRQRFRKEVFGQINAATLKTRGKYVYSDLGFLLYPELISKLTNRNFENYMQTEFFKPLGANRVTYKPLDKFPISQIPPTEEDTTFRKTLVHGFVHDESAAVMGGISGNAGLFASAEDLAKLLQMYLQQGYYGGHQYLDPAVVKRFTQVQFPDYQNRRGLGFDKPLLDNASQPQDKAYPVAQASPDSFGHSGFTGTFVWMDPQHNLLYVFLSNRVHPTRANTKLFELSTRTRILEKAYQALQGTSSY